jgi:peptide/nickel transport system ATP-binding protein
MRRVLQVRGLSTVFKTRAGTARAVNDVSFHVDQGEVLGLVGESGSGKSMTGYSLMGLVDAPGHVESGSIVLNGQEVSGLSERQWRRIRGDRIAMIFQDPMATLNPVLSIGTQMLEALGAHQKVGKREARERVIAALSAVGIAAPEERLAAYPHQFSGGMRQRVCIAIALLNRPDLIICDEPTTALDVTIQAQILSEMQTLCRERGTALIWITHDLSIVAGLADRVAVMYAGRIVESGSTAEVIDDPRHPYTRGLIDSTPAAAVLRAAETAAETAAERAVERAVERAHPGPSVQSAPNADPGTRSARALLKPIPGFTPAMTGLPAGCPFHPRCSRATSDCLIEPSLITEQSGRSYRCFHPIGANTDGALKGSL